MEDKVKDEVSNQEESVNEIQEESNNTSSDIKSKVIDLIKKFKGIIIVIGVIIAVYLGFSLYFINHYNWGTTINGVDVSFKTVQQADELIAANVTSYSLSFTGRVDYADEISASDIDLTYNSNGQTEEVKDSQNPFAWIVTLIKNDNIELSDIISYDDDLLSSAIDNLSCFTADDIIYSENPTFEYEDGSYVVNDEVYGTEVNRDSLYTAVVDAIINGDSSLDLDEEDCYNDPTYTTDSQEVQDALETLNEYVSVTVTYESGDTSMVLDGSTINTFLYVDDSYNVEFDEDVMYSYATKVASTFNTYGSSREFTTSYGTTVTVDGGNYGWIVDKSSEVTQLISDIQSGEDVDREPVFSQTAFESGSSDVGNTYVEVDLTGQHIWYYVDGELVVEGDIVSGDESDGNSTPTGTYRLNYKESNATLSGDDYDTDVCYWMPFNGNIGLHDAWWRTSFGGTIYKTNGSHGCVNLPSEVAAAIFEQITAGTPIICYTTE